MVQLSRDRVGDRRPKSILAGWAVGLPVFERAGGRNLIVLRGPGADTLSMATHGSDRKGLDEPVANACFEEAV